MFLVVTNRLGDLLAIVRSSLDLQEAEGGAASVTRSPPVVLISLNDNYCLNFHTALNSVKEPNVGFVPARTFCSKCKFCFKQPEASAKERSKSSCKPDKCFNKRCKLCSSFSYSVSVPPAPVRMSAVSTAKVPTMWPPSYHKQGSNLLKGHILYLGPLR